VEIGADAVTRWELRQADARDPQADISDVMLLWTDPPYGTGKAQSRGDIKYRDTADTRYVIEAILSWLPKMHPNGTVVVCCDYRLAPWLTVAIGAVGWSYRGEIVWEFGLGRPRTSWWPVRHNNLLTFTRSDKGGKFDATAVPRVERQSRLSPSGHKSGGKRYHYPDDRPAGSVWALTVPGTDSSRVGYPNEKPVQIVEPFILAHTEPGDLVLDVFCGSAASGAAAVRHGRDYIGIDISSTAIEVATSRLNEACVIEDVLL
jgi:site-specific DNA-methyltransferase (adenine-specific)